MSVALNCARKKTAKRDLYHTCMDVFLVLLGLGIVWGAWRMFS